MTMTYLKDSLRLTFRWRLDDFGRLLDEFRVTLIYLAFQFVLNTASVGSEILDLVMMDQP